MSNRAKSSEALGFLTVVDDQEQGLIGGYLVLNSRGQPLEFHCTAPVRPNRAQEILYGPTLGTYLSGEQIGGVLAAKVSSNVGLVCTDQEAVLALTDIVKTPVVLITGTSPASESPTESAIDGTASSATDRLSTRRIDNAHATIRRLHVFSIGANSAALRRDHAGEEPRVSEALLELGESIDLLEPFDRIREAIAEAQRNAR